MPHYYDNYGHPYHEEYPVDHYSPRRPRRSQPLAESPRHLQYPSRPRRYSQSQLYDSTPDAHYPTHVTQQPRQGLRRQPTWDAARGLSRQSGQHYSSYPSAHSTLLQQQQRQDPRMFQDPHQYEIRQRRSSTGNYPSRMDHVDYDYDHADNDHNAGVNADSDDDSLNTLEMLALENAKRNENPLASTPSPFDPDNLTIPLSAQVNDVNTGRQQHPQYPSYGTGLDDNTNVTNDPPPMVSSGTLSKTLTDSTAISSSQQQQQQQQLQQQEQHDPSKDPSKKRRWSLSYLFRKSSTGSNFSKTSYNLAKTPSPSNSLSLSSNSSDFSHHSNDNNNRNINNSRNIPPPMLPKQKQKQKQPQPSIVTFRNPLPPSPPNTNSSPQQRVLGDAEKTALLDYIWAFKAPQGAAQLVSPDNNPNVWTGFDYKNQELITKHAMTILKNGGEQATATTADPGLELFDSHIRKGTLPFLVVISQQMAYYPTSNNTIDKIEIKCLPNTKDTVLLRKKKKGT